LVIANKNTYSWHDVTFSINAGLFDKGYFINAGRIDAGGIYTVGLMTFANKRGERFNPFQMKARDIQITAKKPDGTFGVELLQERGAYDATDAEVIAALAGKRGMARIMDAGEQLINKSYILVFDFHDTKTMNQYYNEVDKKRRETAKLLETSFTPIERTHEGYRTDMDAHLFRIDFNDSVSAVFYQELWIDPTTLIFRYPM